MFRFTIRELVLLTLGVAMGVGWWLDHRGLRARANETHFQLLSTGLELRFTENLLREARERLASKESIQAARTNSSPSD